MKKTSIILLLMVVITAAHAQNALLDCACRALPATISSNEMARALDAGLWNSNKTALAVSLSDKQRSYVFVFVRSNTTDFIMADASAVEGGNLGKLGSIGRSAYEKIETKPIAWLNRTDDLLQVEIRTRVWKGGKRYTVAEPLVLRRDGRVYFR